MAQRVENPFSSRFGENAGVQKYQHKMKAMAVAQPNAHQRQALGQIGNHASAFEATHAGKDVKPNCFVVPSRKAPVRKHGDEGLATEREGRPRSFSFEPMDIGRDTPIKGKEHIRMKNVTDIDADDFENQFACAEYANEIYGYLKKREPLFQVPGNYIQYHHQINERMRAILVDWLVQVHDKFRLLQETLFLTISILDRYLAVDCKVTKGNLQLVGVTAMLLASKIEEIYTPEIRDFVYITDNAYSSVMIRDLESKMATALEYNFGDPLCIHFLRRNSKAAKADAEKHTLAKYFMELMLPDYECIAFPPSQRAAASLCLAMKITDNSLWTETMQHYSQYKEESLQPCLTKIAQLIVKSANKQSKLLSVSTKYNRGKFFKVASSPCMLSPYITSLAQQ